MRTIPSQRTIPTIAVNFGRILLASLFIMGGLNKILNYASTGATMDDLGFPFVAILLPLTIALELGGGLAVAIGRSEARTAAILLRSIPWQST